MLSTRSEHILHLLGLHFTLTRCIVADIITESSPDHASMGDGLYKSGESHGHRSCIFCHRVSSLIRNNIVWGILEVCEEFNNSENDSADKMK